MWILLMAQADYEMLAWINAHVWTFRVLTVALGAALLYRRLQRLRRL